MTSMKQMSGVVSWYIYHVENAITKLSIQYEAENRISTHLYSKANKAILTYRYQLVRVIHHCNQ